MIQILLKFSSLILAVSPVFLFAEITPSPATEVFSFVEQHLFHVKESQVLNLIRQIYAFDLSDVSLNQITHELNQILLFGDIDRCMEYDNRNYQLYILLEKSIDYLLISHPEIKGKFLSLLKQEIINYYSNLPHPDFLKTLLLQLFKSDNVDSLLSKKLNSYKGHLIFYMDIKNFLFKTNRRKLYKEIKPLQANSIIKLKFFHGKTLTSLEIADIFLDYSQDPERVAKQLHHLFTTTNFLAPKYYYLYRDIFIVLFKAYLKNLSSENKVALNHAIAQEMLSFIQLETEFSEFLKLEIESPQIPTLTYLEFYQALIIPSEQFNTFPHVSHKEDDKFSFTQPRVLVHLHINDLLLSPEINSKDLAKFINNVFLNTDFYIIESELKSVLIYDLYEYFSNISKNEEEDFLKLLAEEIKNTINLGPKFYKFLENEMNHPTAGLAVYLEIYNNIMSHYHSKARVEGYLEPRKNKPIFMMQLYSEDILPIYSLLKEPKPVSDDNLRRLSKMLAYIFLHTQILYSSSTQDHSIFENLLKYELSDYIKSLDTGLKYKFYEFLVISISEDSFFSEKVLYYLQKINARNKIYNIEVI